MSVFGGDSWGREAQKRKRRVEDLLLVSESAIDASSPTFKKLSNGQFACLVCPHNPVLHSPLVFSTHCKGSRHIAAESRLRARELARREEASKRIALAHSLRGKGIAEPRNYSQNLKLLNSEPVIERARKASCEEDRDSRGKSLEKDSSSSCVAYGNSYSARSRLDCRERREKELKFTAAGWKRDCHGKWYKDENVEFDSDEEDPNECLG